MANKNCVFPPLRRAVIMLKYTVNSIHSLPSINPFKRDNIRDWLLKTLFILSKQFLYLAIFHFHQTKTKQQQNLENQKKKTNKQTYIER